MNARFELRSKPISSEGPETEEVPFIRIPLGEKDEIVRPASEADAERFPAEFRAFKESFQKAQTAPEPVPPPAPVAPESVEPPPELVEMMEATAGESEAAEPEHKGGKKRHK